MKLLNGKELADYIKQRQAYEVRRLRQSSNIIPKLAIIQTKDDPVINTYVRLKKLYGSDILVDVEDYSVAQKEVPGLIERLNKDNNTHGIIVQLPLEDTNETNKIVNLVDGGKDVDALGDKTKYMPATPNAILWLLAGYNVELKGKKILLIGRGRLVGGPLEKILKSQNLDVESVGREASDLKTRALASDIIITATGTPEILKTSMIKTKAIVIDAGVASDSGKTVGDVVPEVYRRNDLTITPAKGGVGPLTVCSLFENVILAAKTVADS